ncbi:MAG: VOC family protein [Dehalococcoidales bacterium]|nr:VOC family protein [Dehalococcoidales bacterium]
MPVYWHDHIHLTTPDAAKTADFYETMFNARLVNTRKTADGRTSVELDLNGSRILIIERGDKASTATETGYGIEHFGILTDNIEAAVADLKTRGVRFRDEVREASPGLKICFLWGPENVLIELMQRGR